VVIIGDNGIDWLEYCMPEKYESCVVKIDNALPFILSFSFLYNILRSVVKTGFTGTSLLSAIVLELKPKVIITYIDDNKFMGELQAIFPHILIISVQNGTRSISDLSFGLRRGCLGFPHYFGFGGYELSVMDLLGVGVKRYYSVGSIKMGIFLSYYYKPKYLLNKKNICFISQYVSSVYNSSALPGSMDARDLAGFQEICKLLSKFSRKNNIKIRIAMRNHISSKSYQDELNFYQEAFDEGVMEICQRDRLTMSSYQVGMDSDLIIAYHSTLLFELLGADKKILSYGNVDKKFRDMLSCNNLFDVMPSEFLLDSWGYESFEEKVNLLLNMNEFDFLNKAKIAKEHYMNFSDKYPHQVIHNMIQEKCKQ